MMSKKKKKLKPPKKRNPYALIAQMKRGAGLHTDDRKERSKNKCREHITEDEMRGE